MNPKIFKHDITIILLIIVFMIINFIIAFFIYHDRLPVTLIT